MVRIPVIMLLIVLALVGSVLAQDDACALLVEGAYDLTQEACAAIHDEEACYGNARIQAQPGGLDFDTTGDRVGLAEIQSLRLSSMDVDHGEWGISLMRFTAKVPEQARPTSVQLVLFGNVEIENAAEGTDFAPMQAFYFRSGPDDSSCQAMPDSGILIQTPRGEGEVTLLINEVVVDLGSTAYVQSGDDLIFNVLEGQVTVDAGGTAVTAPAGTFTSVALDENGSAVGEPEAAQPYDPDDLQTLPIELLPDGITIAEVAGRGSPFNMHRCRDGVWFVPSGRSITVQYSIGEFPSLDAARAANPEGHLLLDGVALDRTFESAFVADNTNHYLAGYDLGVLAPGTYLLESRYAPEYNNPSCTLVVGGRSR